MVINTSPQSAENRAKLNTKRLSSKVVFEIKDKLYSNISPREIFETTFKLNTNTFFTTEFYDYVDNNGLLMLDNPDTINELMLMFWQYNNEDERVNHGDGNGIDALEHLSHFGQIIRDHMGTDDVSVAGQQRIKNEGLIKQHEFFNDNIGDLLSQDFGDLLMLHANGRNPSKGLLNMHRIQKELIKMFILISPEYRNNKELNQAYRDFMSYVLEETGYVKDSVETILFSGQPEIDVYKKKLDQEKESHDKTREQLAEQVSTGVLEQIKNKSIIDGLKKTVSKLTSKVAGLKAENDDLHKTISQQGNTIVRQNAKIQRLKADLRNEREMRDYKSGDILKRRA